MSLDHVDNGWDEDGCGDVARVATALTTLCANDVDAEVEALLDVLGVTLRYEVSTSGDTGVEDLRRPEAFLKPQKK